MKMLRKIMNVTVDVIVIFILIVSTLVVVLSLTSKSSGVSNLFGIAPLNVESISMEDTFTQGDLILCKVTDGSEEFAVGDIVTFPIMINNISTFNTHRIVEVIEDENITYYRTQGDNAETNPVPDNELQTSSSIVAKYTGTKIEGLGSFFAFIRTQLGFFLCILLPMIIFFVYQAIRVIINVIAYNQEKAIENAQAAVNSSELTEEQKRKAIEEYLASIGQSPTVESEVQTPANDSDVNETD